jgi:hypothetical protein
VAAISSPAFKRYKTESYFCLPECKLQDQDGHPLYFDSGHLTLKGAEMVRPLAREIFINIEKDSHG